jgi:hypothetical protein
MRARLSGRSTQLLGGTANVPHRKSIGEPRDSYHRISKRPAVQTVTWEEVCAIGLALPQVEPGSYHGYPALRVAGKFLVRLSDDGENIEFKALDVDEREEMLLAEPALFHVPAGFKGAGVFARLDALDERVARELLAKRWRASAPRKIVKAYDTDH